MTDPTTYVRCPACKGTGTVGHTSDCCGAIPRKAGDTDTMEHEICSCCGDQCEYLETKCTTCEGLGEVTQAQRKAYLESLKEYEPESKFNN